MAFEGDATAVIASLRDARSAAASSDMCWIPAGEFTMGSDRHYREEAPARRVRVEGFWIDASPVTNAAFAAFVTVTGYRTIAERPLGPADFPGVAAADLVAGSLVFRRTDRPVDTRDMRHWWHWTPGACWHRPEGPGSSLAGRDEHPVVHVALADAEAYAGWIGKALPSEAEWEHAARGGLDGCEFAWGDAFTPGGHHMANTWQGTFPWRDLASDGFAGTSPVGSYLPNGYELFDMIGNVWEWTADWWSTAQAPSKSPSCCGAQDAEEARRRASCDPAAAGQAMPRKVLKGGSFLCAPSYCRRYRPAARHAQMIDSGMSHIGFRCVRRPPPALAAACNLHSEEGRRA